MEGHSVIRCLAGDRLRHDLAGDGVDGAEVDGAGERDVMGGDRNRGLAPDPGQPGGGLGLVVVAEEFEPVEAAGLEGLGDGPLTDRVAFGDGAQVGAAEPTDEGGRHATDHTAWLRFEGGCRAGAIRVIGILAAGEAGGVGAGGLPLPTQALILPTVIKENGNFL